MTRGTLFYYESASKVWSSTEFNGDMYHGTPEKPEGEGDKVIKLMTNLNSLDDFKTVLKEINKDYDYKEGNDCWSVAKDAIDEDIKNTIKWIETERKDLIGNKTMDPREWDKKPTFKDVNTWDFWGTPNLSDYSYIYNNSGRKLTITTREGKMDIPNGGLGVLNYGRNDCICKDGKIIDGMGTYKVSPSLDAMDKKEFYNYITENFTLDGTSRNLVLNILDFVEHESNNIDEVHDMLTRLLDGLDLKEEEIKHAMF
jgi:hypothetical protein